MGVVAAHVFSKQRKRSESAIDLFAKIARDVQCFQNVFITHCRLLGHPSEELRNRLPDSANDVLTAVADLEFDRTLLDLLFSNNADKMKANLQGLMDLVPDAKKIDEELASPRTMHDSKPEQEVTAMEALKRKMGDLSLAISSDMKPLYNSLSDVCE